VIIVATAKQLTNRIRSLGKQVTRLEKQKKNAMKREAKKTAKKSHSSRKRKRR